MRYLYKLLSILSWPFLWFFLRDTKRARVAITHNGTLLLVRNKFGSQRWTLPGGGAKRNELPSVAAVREMKEELKVILEPKKLKRQKAFKIRAWKIPYQIIMYSVSLDSKPDIRISFEVLDYEWVDVNELDNYGIHPKINKQLQRLIG